MNANERKSRVYFAIGRCQFDRACHAARYGDSRAAVRSPEFATAAELGDWIKSLTAADRRCRSCLRPIAAKRFERRYYDQGAIYSYPVADEVPVLGYWPDGLEAFHA